MRAPRKPIYFKCEHCGYQSLAGADVDKCAKSHSIPIHIEYVYLPKHEKPDRIKLRFADGAINIYDFVLDSE